MPKKIVSFFIFCLIMVVASCSNPKKNRKIVNQTIVQNAESFSMPELPLEMTFGNQLIKLDNFDIKERMDRELIVNTFYHSSTIQSFKRANRFFPVIDKILKEEGIPVDFKYLCLIESGLVQAVSPSGAKGFWQFMPETGEEYDLTINGEVDERLHIEKSTRAACAYLRNANLKFNDWILTSAAYNRGVGGIENNLEEQEVTNYFDLHLNDETSRYVFRILALKLIFENPEEYGYDKDKITLYEPIAVRSIQVKESIDDMKHWAIANGSNYHMLKVLNPWIISNKLTFKGFPHTIQLPKN